MDKKVLEKVAEDVDGHPFALELLVGIANDMGVSNALKEIELYRKERLNKIKIQKRLFEKLGGDEKELLERISVFRKPESLNTLKIMTTDGISVDDLRNHIRKSLLKVDEMSNFWLHSMIREFSYDDLKNKKGIHHLALSYYMVLKLPGKSTKKDDVQSLIEACYHACRAGKYDEAANIIFVINLHEDLDRWGEGNRPNNLGTAFEDEKKQMYREALACYLLAREIRIQIKDPNLITTESNLKALEEKLGKKKFEQLIKEVEPAGEDVVKKIIVYYNK